MESWSQSILWFWVCTVCAMIFGHHCDFASRPWLSADCVCSQFFWCQIDSSGNGSIECYSDTHTRTHLTSLFLGLPRWAGTTKVKPIWILLKQETVSGSGISWAICKSAPCSRRTTTPAPHHSVFYSPDALPAAQPTASKHWRHIECYSD